MCLNLNIITNRSYKQAASKVFGTNSPKTENIITVRMQYGPYIQNGHRNIAKVLFKQHAIHKNINYIANSKTFGKLEL